MGVHGENPLQTLSFSLSVLSVSPWLMFFQEIQSWETNAQQASDRQLGQFVGSRIISANLRSLRLPPATCHLQTCLAVLATSRETLERYSPASNASKSRAASYICPKPVLRLNASQRWSPEPS